MPITYYFFHSVSLVIAACAAFHVGMLDFCSVTVSSLTLALAAGRQYSLGSKTIQILL